MSAAIPSDRSEKLRSEIGAEVTGRSAASTLPVRRREPHKSRGWSVRVALPATRKRLDVDQARILRIPVPYVDERVGLVRSGAW